MTKNSLPEKRTRIAKSQARSRRVRESAKKIITYTLMTALGAFFLFPIIFMIVASFKPDEQVITELASIKAFLPDFNNLTMENVNYVFEQVPFGRYFFSSLVVTFLAVTSGLFINSMAAYSLARMRWLGQKFVLAVIVSLIIIPLESIAIPLFMQINQMSSGLNLFILGIFLLLLGLIWTALWNATGNSLRGLSFLDNTPNPLLWLLQALATVILSLPFEILVYILFQQWQDGGTWMNSYHVQILPFVAEPFSIFLFYQFFIEIPKDFDEAAYVDGAGFFQIYWQLMVPLSRPVFATVAILKSLMFWSFYLWPLLVVREAKYRPLMVGMANFQTQEPIKWGSIMAYASLVTVPVLIVFLLFQKWFVQSVSSSGVKG
jgi:multiple sugar transport system permease protein